MRSFMMGFRSRGDWVLAMAWVVGVAAATSVTGCTDPAPPVSGNTTGTTDKGTGTGADGSIITPLDLGKQPELPKETVQPDPGPLLPEVTEQGAFGSPCGTNADCNSDWCVPTSSGKLCSVTCQDTCPAAGWGCKPVLLGGSDPTYVCVPTFQHLCDPCNADTECTAGIGDIGDRCIPKLDGSGSFCGGECGANVSCPDGFDCVDSTAPGAAATKQCQKKEGECTCSDAAIARKAETACWRKNEHGTCNGVRACGADGLSSCSAATPAAETCDNEDNDCDGKTDEEGAAGCVVYFKDLDGDDAGIDGDSKCLCAPDATYRGLKAGDCDDKSSAVNPGATELCNGKDDDCDLGTDEVDALGCKDWYADSDNDKFGDDKDRQCLCAPTALHSTQKPGDCDDKDALAYPQAPETCGSKDANCDGKVAPENTTGCTLYYVDTDVDKYGVATAPKCLCQPETPNTALELGDCEDNNNAINPKAAEICNGKDDDCDGDTDPPDSGGCTTYYRDVDGDLVGNGLDSACLCTPTATYPVQVGGDCEDDNKAVNPSATELCNGKDDDCDTQTDEQDALGCKLFYRDEDEDDVGLSSDSLCLCSAFGDFRTNVAGDCNDDDPGVAPTKSEKCNTKDDNCDGNIDEAGAESCSVYYADLDEDTFGVEAKSKCLCAPDGAYTAKTAGDCDDDESNVHPDQVETCNAVDDDCDTATDEENADGCIKYYEDADKDGFGITASVRCLCAPEKPFTAQANGECKDTNEDINPGVTEACNTVDDDCDTFVDEENATNCTTYYYDGDADGFGKNGTQKCLCGPVDKWNVLKGGDCDDLNLLVYPGQPCKGPSCSGFLLTDTLACGGSGSCDVGGATAPCPGGYVCQNGAACKALCTSDQDCIQGNFCVNNQCSGQKADGAPCFEDGQCLSNHCNNGFCCQGTGKCCGGLGSQCNDDNPCTDDTCSNQFQCATGFNHVSCAAASCDGSEFTEAKFCDQGTCSGGGLKSTCDGTDPCRIYSCTLSGCKTVNAKVGTVCAAASCDGYVATGQRSCDANGGCSVGGAVLACPGGYVCQDASSCKSGCTTDNDCSPSFHCNGGQCYQDKGDGSSCTTDHECKAGHCQNGFCCATGVCCGGKDSDCNDGNACTTDYCSVSFTCAQVNNSDQCAPGTCTTPGGVSTYSDPRFCNGGACPAQAVTHACTGTNPCLFYSCSTTGCVTTPVPIGTTCVAATCATDVLTNPKVCDGLGNCSLGGGSGKCAGGLTCESSKECRKTCTDDLHCQTGNFCKAGFCTPKSDNGKACGANNECTSGHCENGFCCATGKCCATAANCNDGLVCTTDTCTGFQCVTSFNTVKCQEGACSGATYIGPKFCKFGQCNNGGAETGCVGTNPCETYGCGPAGCEVGNAAAGTICSPASCGGDGVFIAPKTCDGTGACSLGAGQSPCPGGYACLSAAACGATCADDTDCQTGYFCALGVGSPTCQIKRLNGDACTADAQCQSTHCQNGYCCATGKCCGLSLHCDDGQVCTTDLCNAQKQCTYQSNSLTCQTAQCDGLTFTAAKTCAAKACPAANQTSDCSGTDPCKTYACSLTSGCVVGNASAGTQCAPATCFGFKLTTALTCNGGGTCAVGGVENSCPGGYTCLNAGACRSACSDDTQCQSGYYCTPSSQCQLKRPDGDACSASAQCSSGYCSNGYCCNSVSGKCCSQDFHCGDAKVCTDDKCVNFLCQNTSNVAPCQTASCSNLVFTASKTCSGGACSSGGAVTDCSGTNPCKSYGCDASGCTTQNVSVGVQCTTQVCSGFELTQAKTCNGSGTCSVGGSKAPCQGGYACLDGTACRTSCQTSAECQSSYYCENQVCLPKRGNGEACTSAASCQSGYCASTTSGTTGFCCAGGSGAKCCGNVFHCDDGNPCTIDKCTSFQCTYDTSSADGTACQSSSCSGLSYTSPKICNGGQCNQGGTVTECSSANPCRPQICTTTGCKFVDNPAGTPCADGTCSGFSISAGKTCALNGQGVMDCVGSGGTGSCPGGYMCASSTSCRTSCAVDSECQSGFYCENAKCIPKKSSGASCTATAQCTTSSCNQCQSNHCENGYCCGSGKCCAGNADCNDGNVCTNDSCDTSSNRCCGPAGGGSCPAAYYNVATCQAASCSGLTFTEVKVCSSGSCPAGTTTQDCKTTNVCLVATCSDSLGCQTAPAPTGTQCKAPKCEGALLTQASSCASGSCQNGSTAACPGNLKCADTVACKTSCATDSDCVGGFYCSSGTCLLKKASGETCSGSTATQANAQCQSDYCNSNICCGGGQCCTADSQCVESPTDNPCTSNYCQNNQCQKQNNSDVCQTAFCEGLIFHSKRLCAAASCQPESTQNCGGSVLCHQYACTSQGCTDTATPAGTTCGDASCASGILTQARTCDGAGLCQNATVGPCAGNYACLNATSCKTICAADTDCRGGYYCQLGQCVTKKSDGDVCASGNQCQSNYCSNGYCCVSGKCCSQNVHCNDGNVCTDDTCQNNQCSTANNSLACGSGTCNGLLFTGAKSCSGGTCSGGGLTSSCGGVDPCLTYSCTETGCQSGYQPSGTTCATPVCQAGNQLTTTRQCNGSGSCSDGGTTGPCSGNFLCKDSVSCHTTCTSSAQCTAAAYCSNGACLAKKADGGVCSQATECQSNYCSNGYCCAGGTCCVTASSCADSNVCTDDLCQANMCTKVNNTAPCAASTCNGLIWNAPKTCSGGSCPANAQQTPCTGTETCMTYTCSNVGGCGATPKASGIVCSSGACTGSVFTPPSLCDGLGSCAPSTPKQCADQDYCNGAELCDATAGCQTGTAPWICGDQTCDPTCETATSCVGDCRCVPSYSLSPGEVDSWNSAGPGAVNRISKYGSCVTGTFPGNEYTYSFTAPIGGPVKIELRGGDANTYAMVLSDTGTGCDPAQCIAATQAASSTTFTALSGKTYYITVDRKNAGGVDFQLYLHYGVSVCSTIFTETFDRTPFPRAWSTQNGWKESQDSPFGATHAKFTTFGGTAITNPSQSFTSPAFESVPCGTTKVTFDWRFKQLSWHPGVLLELQAAPDGTNFTTVWSYDSAGDGSSGDATKIGQEVSVPALANKTAAKLRFRVTGDTTSFIDKIQIDNVRITQ